MKIARCILNTCTAISFSEDSMTEGSLLFWGRHLGSRVNLDQICRISGCLNLMTIKYWKSVVMCVRPLRLHLKNWTHADTWEEKPDSPRRLRRRSVFCSRTRRDGRRHVQKKGMGLPNNIAHDFHLLAVVVKRTWSVSLQHLDCIADKSNLPARRKRVNMTRKLSENTHFSIGNLRYLCTNWRLLGGLHERALPSIIFDVTGLLRR